MCSYNPYYKNDYNIHTYYWPETPEEFERAKAQYDYPDLIDHGTTHAVFTLICDSVMSDVHACACGAGGYFDGINKDAYDKADFEYSYIDAVMQSLDTIDTFKSWIDELDPTHNVWANMMNYTLTRERDIHDLYFGSLKLFSISAYVRLAW